jgi:hypothetical protein
MKDEMKIIEFVKLYKDITLHWCITRNISETYLESPAVSQNH